MMKTERPEHINPAQWRAITSEAKRILIVAGPGTGKTFTLTQRVARELPQLPPGRKALVMTFTNKAAGEMRERLRRLKVRDEEQFFVGTFHAFCYDFLKARAGRCGLPPDLSIVSTEEVQETVAQLFPQKAKNERLDLLARYARFQSLDFDSNLPQDVEILHQNLRSGGRMDFDGLLFETWRILFGEPQAVREVRETFAAVYVDEFQDINRVQYELLRLWVGPAGRLTAIGDPNQSIYGFRGADAGLFQRFQEDFAPAETYSLEENYRSGQNILTASAQILGPRPAAPVPGLTARLLAEGKITFYQAATDRAEAEFVVHTIEKLVGGTSMFSQDSGRVAAGAEAEYGFGDFAVLFRMKSLARPLAEALERSGIPYTIVGKGEEAPQEQVCPGRGQDNTFAGDRVALMSLHAGKGLEFPVVFIVGCEEGIIPLAWGDYVGEVQEERRLLYVGMTRARHLLFLTHAARRTVFGRSRQQNPSPFLLDIASSLREYHAQEKRPARKSKDDEQLSLF